MTVGELTGLWIYRRYKRAVIKLYDADGGGIYEGDADGLPENLLSERVEHFDAYTLFSHAVPYLCISVTEE